MSDFQHFIITRMNIDWEITPPRTDRNEIDVLQYRFNIFEQTCYPSVNGQTNKNFIWLLLLDAETPSIFRDKVEQYQSNPQILPLFIVNRDTCLETIRAAIDANTEDSTPYIITTSLDSDDAISEDYIDNVQSQFKKQDFVFINFPFGYLYQFKEEKLYLREWLHAPIYSLIEKRSLSCDTALKYFHVEISKYNIIQVFTKPMWLMTVHQKNVLTKFDVSAAWQPLRRLGDRFNVKIDFSQKSLSASPVTMLSEAWKIITSKRKSVDTLSVKARKITNVFFPSLLILVRKIKYSD